MDALRPARDPFARLWQTCKHKRQNCLLRHLAKHQDLNVLVSFAGFVHVASGHLTACRYSAYPPIRTNALACKPCTLRFMPPVMACSDYILAALRYRNKSPIWSVRIFRYLETQCGAIGPTSRRGLKL